MRNKIDQINYFSIDSNINYRQPEREMFLEIKWVYTRISSIYRELCFVLWKIYSKKKNRTQV